jgi:hypothetical protein
MCWDLIQPNNAPSGQTQSKTENSRPERPIEGRKSVLSDPASAKKRRNRAENLRLVKKRLHQQTEWWS